MAYQQVLQTSDQEPGRYSQGFADAPEEYGLQSMMLIATYQQGGVNQSARITVQAQGTGLSLSPDKQYRITVEEVVP